MSPEMKSKLKINLKKKTNMERRKPISENKDQAFQRSRQGCMLHFLSEMLDNSNGQEGKERRERGKQLQIILFQVLKPTGIFVF